MKTRSKVLAAMMAAVWCAAPYAQSTTTESKTLPGATPQYPPAANSQGLDTAKPGMKKTAKNTNMSNSATTTASNDTAPRKLPARRDRN
jgi:hypothetical protein